MADGNQQLTIVTLGEAGQGKTTLTASLTKVGAERFGGEFSTYESLSGQPLQGAHGVRLSGARVEYGSAARKYVHLDFPDDLDCAKYLIAPPSSIEGAILVCGVRDGAASQAEAQIRLARHAGVSHIVVFLNMWDGSDDPGLASRRELEMRELLSSYGFSRDDTPVVRGSAPLALDDDQSELGVPSIIKLVDALDAWIPDPERDIDKPFLMAVEDVSMSSGPAIVLTGRVERGIVKTRDMMELVGVTDTQTTTVIGVEISRKLREQAQAGDNIGVAARGLQYRAVMRGQVLAKPGTVTPHKEFEGEVYVLTHDEGGLGKPCSGNDRPTFHFRTAGVIGSIKLPEGVETVMPGDIATISVRLDDTIAMDEGLRFTIREGDLTIGAGIVAKIIE
jgi:elongation factor Tu